MMLSTAVNRHKFDVKLCTAMENKWKSMSDDILASNFNNYTQMSKLEDSDKNLESKKKLTPNQSVKLYAYHPAKGPINCPTKVLAQRPSDYPTLKRRPTNYSGKGPISLPLLSFRERKYSSMQLSIDCKQDRTQQIKHAYKVNTEKPDPDDHNTAWYINWMTRRKKTLCGNQIMLNKILRARSKIATFR